MHKRMINFENMDIDVYSLNTLVVGSGAAGFNAADSLYNFGQKDIAIVTEGICMGTSRNTGSDKQTYYKLTLAGNDCDSVQDMAKILYDGGSMHGDIALVEAALSAQCFYKLCSIGVSFPHNKYGEYIGYKTDHDTKKRATSAGPLTSRFMTECLENQVKSKGIQIFDGYLVIGILTDDFKSEEIKAIGLIALNLKEMHKPNYGVTLFNCTNIIYAVGGPAGMYENSVYPESQIGASGIAFEAGAKGINLTESQYGIASIKFRWNLSGTYQQVIPRYVSTNAQGGDEKEFLEEYFENPGQMLNAIFLKGYQWPFDPRKVSNYGSSVIDLLVYHETQIKGRRVFLDYCVNPKWGSKDGELDFSHLGEEAYTYLQKSGALSGKPIDRLKIMNSPAIELYKSNGIDLSKEYLEIAVCAQHNNGGLMGNIWWESNVKHLFPVGEVNGTFGVNRPGGSALNSTQVGSLRAAQYINAKYTEEPMELNTFFQVAEGMLKEKLGIIKKLIQDKPLNIPLNDIRKIAVQRMSKNGAFIRDVSEIEKAKKECLEDIQDFHHKTKIESVYGLIDAFRTRDILITQWVYLNAISDYIKNGGGSRGSYIVVSKEGKPFMDKVFGGLCMVDGKEELRNQVCITQLIKNSHGFKCDCKWENVRPIPMDENWFETVWKEYLKSGNIE